MDWIAVLERFGYYALFVGTFLEGETILALAGFFASRDYLSFPIVVVVAFFGAYIGHIFWFYLGRSHGSRLLKKYPHFEKRMSRGLQLIAKYGATSIFVSQYIYGFRIAMAIAFGLSPINFRIFMILQAISCVIWSFLIAGAGYFFGELIETILGKIERIELYATAFIVLIALIIWIWHKRQEKEEEEVGTV